MAGASPADLQIRHRLALLVSHLVVALVALVAVGGATRVMEAGLACPDWPLCYGKFLPGAQMNLQVFLEWFHRLDAFVVGMALLVLASFSYWRRQDLPAWLPPMALGALALVAVQGGLGALTVSQLLAAPTVTAHLATALLLVGLTSGLYQALALAKPQAVPRWWQALAWLALASVFGQCLLGGSMASQWAADQCLATGNSCQWLLAHRQVGMLASLAVALLAASALALPAGSGHLQGLALGGAALVALQVALGVATLRQELQAPGFTVAHQVVAALLVGLLAAIVARALAGSRRSAIQPEWAHG